MKKIDVPQCIINSAVKPGVTIIIIMLLICIIVLAVTLFISTILIILIIIGCVKIVKISGKFPEG